MKTLKRIAIVIIAVSVVAAFGFRLKHLRTVKANETAIVGMAMKGVPVVVKEVTPGVTTKLIGYNGTFEPCHEVTVISETQGNIKTLFVETGVTVNKGDILAEVSNDLILYQLEVAEAAYKKSLKDLSRFENLSPGESVSEQQMEELKLAGINAKATYLSLKKQFDDTRIKATATGTISKRYIEQGGYLAPGSPVVDISDIRTLNFTAWVTADDLRQVKTGQRVVVTTGMYPGKQFDATVSIIGVKPDLSKRYMVQVRVDNGGTEKILAGTDGTLLIDSHSTAAYIVVPRTCLVTTWSETSVFVVENGIALLRPVTVKEMTDNEAVIEEGLSEGDIIVTSGQINLQDSMKVIVRYN